mgnify:CR=1 FL=1
MKTYEFGNSDADVILIQMTDDHELETIENEVRLIKEYSGTDFRMIAIKAEDWNDDLSPWASPAVFGDKGFAGNALNTLNDVLSLCTDKSRTYYIGGYSLAGLFALWAAYQTDIFRGVAAASPSLWFPGFTDYMESNDIRCSSVYLSLGDKEEKTKNPVMSKVGDNIRLAYDILKKQGVNCILEWNQGNHFRDADIRTAKAFLWVLKNG